MQTIMEPIFDVAYLVSVITIGIKMIRRTGGPSPIRRCPGEFIGTSRSPCWVC